MGSNSTPGAQEHQLLREASPTRSRKGASRTRAVGRKALGQDTRNCEPSLGVILKSYVSQRQVSVPKAGSASDEAIGNCQGLQEEGADTSP